MGRVQETFGVVNTTLRTLLMLILVGGAAVGGYKLYDVYNEPRKQLADKQAELDAAEISLRKAATDLEARQKEVMNLTAEVEKQAAQIERLDVAMRLLKVRKRLARLTVLNQQPVTAADAPPRRRQRRPPSAHSQNEH
jgi:hypothetical protein